MTPTGPSPEAPANPAGAAYSRSLGEREATHRAKVRLERRIADARLAVFVLGLALVGLAFVNPAVRWWWSLAPAAAFLGLVVVHEATRTASRRSARSVAFFERGLKRLDGTWPGSGTGGERFLDPEHLYAADLDLFGPGSVFERLCTARTRAGEDALASWLLGPADPATIGERHQAVAALRPRLDLREDLERIASDVRDGIEPDALAAWGREPAVFESKPTRVAASLLAALTVVSLIGWGLDHGRIPLFSMILVEALFILRHKARVRRVVGVLQRRAHDLVLLSELLDRLEREPFEAGALVRLRASLASGGEPASKRVARLARLVQLLEAKDNQVFAPVAALLLWTEQVAVAIDVWRMETGPAIGGWLAAVGEFEALSALAAYAFENPGDPFPEIAEAGALFDGEAVGHPLIPPGKCVRNDVRLGGELRVLFVSGSNMSGKSTLLRTVGVNTVLALAGAPVRAGRLKVSVLSVGSTLRIQDSLQAGRSRFYAEITRVRRLVDLARGPRPLLFLLDEIFHGTNSHDRSVGAGAVILGLIDLGAIGLVTTHDLALAQTAGTLAPRAANVHFEDQLVDGLMRFDYTMRPGVITHSNALALMRAVGLDV